MTFCIGLLLDYLASYPSEGYSKKLLLTLLAIATPLLVGFSRLYNGDHSMDQILYGWLLGVWIAFSNHYCLRDAIISHIDNLLLKVNPYNSRDISEYFWWATIIFGILISSVIYTFYEVDKNFHIPFDWQ